MRWTSSDALAAAHRLALVRSAHARRLVAGVSTTVTGHPAIAVAFLARSRVSYRGGVPTPRRGTGGISATIKRAMQRPCPTPEVVRVIAARLGGSSFPSGHVLDLCRSLWIPRILARDAGAAGTPSPHRDLVPGWSGRDGRTESNLPWASLVHRRGRVIPRGNVVLAWADGNLPPGENALAQPPTLTAGAICY